MVTIHLSFNEYLRFKFWNTIVLKLTYIYGHFKIKLLEHPTTKVESRCKNIAVKCVKFYKYQIKSRAFVTWAIQHFNQKFDFC